ncbi:MAG: NADH-quinone oxidoreductase subunit M [Propionibacteriaceae bacterium]
MTFPWLTVLGLIPIIGSLASFFLKGKSGKIAGMAIALATLLLGLVIAAKFTVDGGMQFTEDLPWIPAFGAHYALGLDGMGLAMVLLTVVLVPLVLWAEWSYNDRSGRWGGNIFFGLVLFLEGLSIFVFAATDLLLFYLFFEATLIPMYLMIAGYGGPRRRYAAMKFLLFSLAGGLIMLVSVVGLGVKSAEAGTASYLLSDLAKLDISSGLGRWLMVGFLIAFVIKAPMAPLHSWLPDTAEQSTPGTATLLIGILDKIGTFGMIRYCVGLFPEASQWVAPVMIVLAVGNIIYGGLIAIGQKDLMRLVAFISVSHFGVMVLGIYAFTTQSLSGTVFYMVNHGLSTAALMFAILFMVKRRGSTRISDYNGVQKYAPVLAGVTLMAGLSALGLPGMSSFVSEFVVLSGVWSRHRVAAGIATFGIVLSAIYVLNMYKNTMTGPVTAETDEYLSKDLSLNERLVIAPLLVALIALGFFPKPLMQVAEGTSKATMAAVGIADPQPQVGKEGK